MRALFMLLLLLPSMAFAQCEIDWTQSLSVIEEDIRRCEEEVLIRGTVVDPKDYQATLWIGNCTAALVGPRTVFTAAHCTGSGNIGFNVGAQRYTARCVISDDYRRNSTADYSVCHTDREVIGTEYFERVASSPVVLGEIILLHGYGCTRWGTRLDGQLRSGRAKVLGTPSGSNNDIRAGEGATLCSGDSGGPAWSLLPNGDRNEIISTNSRSNTTTLSFLSAWYTAQGRATIEKYRRANPGVLICGLDSNAPKCRNAKPVEPIKFEMEEPGVGGLKVTLNPGAEIGVEDLKAKLEVVLKGVK